MKTKVSLPVADHIALNVVDNLRDSCERIEVAGSIRQEFISMTRDFATEAAKKIGDDFGATPGEQVTLAAILRPLFAECDREARMQELNAVDRVQLRQTGTKGISAVSRHIRIRIAELSKDTPTRC